MRTDSGATFDELAAQWVRQTSKLPSLEGRLHAARRLTTKPLCDKLGVGRSTIAGWCKEGVLQGRICNGRGQPSALALDRRGRS